jgi:hypothetical protein
VDIKRRAAKPSSVHLHAMDMISAVNDDFSGFSLKLAKEQSVSCGWN